MTVALAKSQQVLPALEKEQWMISTLISKVEEICSTHEKAIIQVTVTNTPYGSCNYPIAFGRATNAKKYLREMGYKSKIHYVFETGNIPSVSFGIVIVDKSAKCDKCDRAQMIGALKQKYPENNY